MDNNTADFEKELRAIFEDYDKENENISMEIQTFKQKADLLPTFIESAHDEFERLTGLTKKDSTFVIFATILQIIRQQMINNFKDRLSDKEAAKKFKGDTKETSNRNQRYYASLDDIKTNPVPFDTIQKSDSLKNSNDNPQLSGFNHRYKTLGHDPLLGWIFGTFNILTNTLTMSDGQFLLKSYHVYTGIGTNGSSFYSIDKLSDPADTMQIFSSVLHRIRTEGKDGWEALGAALAKEAMHLLSDVRTAKSLPIPIASWLSPNASRLLNFCGVDTLFLATTTAEATFAQLINFIISKLHEWCYDSITDGEKDLYMVRNMKIITVSNELSTYSSTLEALVRSCMGDANAVVKYDYGGALVTLNNVLNTPIQIAEIKHEYVLSKTMDFFK